jgi:hypothetical protein
MKKFLLSSFFALGIFANAQQETILSENFDSSTSGTRGTWTYGWFGSATTLPAARNDFFIRSNTDCPTSSPNGAGNHMQIVRTTSATAIGNCLYGAQTSSTYAPLIYTTVNAADYKDLLISFKWISGGQVNTDYGFVVYSTDGSSWSPIEDTVTPLQGSSTVQSLVDIPIPEEVNFTTFYIGFRWLANGTTHNAPSLGVDDIVVKGTKPTAIPSCTTLSAPLNNSTVSAGTANFTWNSATDASAYKLTIGTTSGGSDVYSATLTGLSVDVPLQVNSTYYAKVTPTNSVGDAVGCTEVKFNTNSSVAYCIPGANSVDELITKVVFSNISNSSTATSGYENFTSLAAGNVTAGQAYTMTVTNSPAYTGDQTVVWIDYNQDGAFTDSEKTILGGTAASATGSISIPTTAKPGNTRMRVRLHYNNPAITLSPCGNTAYGQTEDYTLNITNPTMAVADVNKANVSVYPNPFHDVLKISEIKDVKSISINDASGREVKSFAPSAELNLSSLKSGLYIVNLKMEDGSVKAFKAIKK